MNAGMHPPALVLNADFRPLSYFPLSLWSWQDSIKAVFLDRVTIITEYEEMISSPSLTMPLPTVIALKEYIPQSRTPAFTRFNVFLRDKFTAIVPKIASCDLTFDHVTPRSKEVGRVGICGSCLQPHNLKRLISCRRSAHVSAEKTCRPLCLAASGKRSWVSTKFSPS